MLLSGKFGIHPSFLLNVPYIIFPFWAMARFLRERPQVTRPQSKVIRGRQWSPTSVRPRRGAWAIFPGAQPTEQPRRDPGGE